MRIRVSVHRFRPDVGGTELMAEMLATSMAERGHEVEVITLRTAAAPLEEWVPVAGPPGASGRPLRYRVRRLEFLRAPVRVPVGYWRALARPTDVLHVFGNRIWNSDFFLPIARWLPAPKVLTGQNFYQYHLHPSPINSLYVRRYFPRMIRRVDCYVVQTVQEREQIRGLGYTGRLELIPHTIDLREFPPDATGGAEFRARHGLGNELLLLSAGGYAPNKRMDRLVEAVARARSRWKLVIAGKDWPGHSADLASVRALAGRLNVPALFLGDGTPVPRDEVIAALAATDVYGQGSSYEGYGGGIQEAMAVQKPFVAFETGAVGEFAAAGAGFSVRTVEEFAHALDRLAASDTERRTMGAAGRAEVVAHRSIEVTMAAYERVFREVAAYGAT